MVLSSNNRMFVGCSFVRYVTTKTGTHVVFYDVVSHKQRRLKLSNMLSLQMLNLQRVRES